MRRAFSSITSTFQLAVPLALLLLPVQAGAQGPLKVTSEPVDCLPIGDNGVGWARVENNLPDTTVRLNFRRMHDTVEDLYYVEMHPAGEGRYWGVFPKAEDQVLDRHDLLETREQAQEEYRWASWWREKQASVDRDPNQDLDDDLIRERASLGKQVPREWLGKMDDETFERWLEQLENEPAEYYTSVHDAKGAQLARSETRVVEVRENCRPDLTAEQLGEAENLTVGETASWQRGEEVFHWLCDGIVTRIGPMGVKRGDEVCRACVIAWYKRPGILVPAATATGVTTGVIIAVGDDDIRPVSPVEP